jgi:hypothetical protein
MRRGKRERGGSENSKNANWVGNEAATRAKTKGSQSVPHFDYSHPHFAPFPEGKLTIAHSTEASACGRSQNSVRLVASEARTTRTTENGPDDLTVMHYICCGICTAVAS